MVCVGIDVAKDKHDCCPGPHEVRIQCPAISNENQLSRKDFVLSISPLVCYIVLAAICNNKQKEGFFMSSQPQKPHPPQAPPSSPETWITAAEAAAALHLSLRTVLSRAASGKLPAKIPNDIPFTYDGKPAHSFHKSTSFCNYSVVVCSSTLLYSPHFYLYPHCSFLLSGRSKCGLHADVVVRRSEVDR